MQRAAHKFSAQTPKTWSGLSHFTCRASPVISCKRGAGAVHQSERVFGRLVPLDAIDAVGAVVVAGDDDGANELLGALVLEALFVPLVRQVPDTQHSTAQRVTRCTV